MIPILTAIALILVMLVLGAENPAGSIRDFFTGPVSSPYALGNMLAQTALLLLTGLGAITAFQVGSFNLGGEGQVYTGAAAAVAAALFLAGTALPAPLAILCILAAGTAAGAGIAAVSGLSRMWWNADELITSFLVGAAAIPAVHYLFQGPLFDSSANLLRTPYIHERFRLPVLLPPSHLSTAAVAAVICWLLFCLILDRGVIGSRFRIVGSSPAFAETEGLPVRRIRAEGFILSGALHGAAGSLLVVGMYHAGIVGFSAGYGWNGIAVALIAANRPKRLLPAALLFSFVIAGARQTIALNQLRLDIAPILQALVFLFITSRIVTGRQEAQK
ncbi:MAG: ABC transporter permease [Spirochaeta sp.]